MKTNFTRLLFTALFFIALQASAQTVGDYRTNFASTLGQWLTPGNWQRFDGSSWVTATAFPTSVDGIITIQSGDSLQLQGTGSNISIDDIVIESGGILVIFNNTDGLVTINNGSTGDDITVNGKLYIAGNADTFGYGTIHVNPTGLFTLRSNGRLGGRLINDGVMHLGSPGNSAGVMYSTYVTNNVGGTCIWIDGNTALSSGAFFYNYGTLNIQTTTAAPVPQWQNIAGANYFTNLGVINKTGTTSAIIATNFENESTGRVQVNNGTLSFSNLTAGTVTNAGTMTTVTGSTLSFANLSNTGTLGGNGTINFTTTNITNSGIISPGASPGTLAMGANAITGKFPTINIELASDGAVQGTNYDHLIVPDAVNITGATLNVTNSTTAADIVGTTYTILTTSAGNITGPFATVNKPTNFSVTYNANSVVLTKTAIFPLPVTWGEFKALAQGSKVLLDWTTLMEENTSHFVIEHSTTGSTFTPVANVEARGNSTYEANYKYTFASPDLTKANYFRIKQVDLDGKSTYSVTRSVKFDKGQVVAIQAYPNPVKDVLTLNIQRENIQVLLADQTGKTIQRLNVQPGQHSINMQSLPTGIYQLAVFEKGVRIETKQIMKQ